MKQKLNKLKLIFLENLEKITSENGLEEIYKDYIGKKGKLNEILKDLKNLSIEDKKIIGPEANNLKNFITEKIEEKKLDLENLKYNDIDKKEEIDVTLEFPSKNMGHKHPISITSEILEDIFISMGYKIEDGPQIETEEYNFDKLNIPADHPARDVWDTFWIDKDINEKRPSGDFYLLRTHTSPVQIRTMLKEKSSKNNEDKDLAIKIIVPGRVYRYEQEDARHTCNFYQLEGLVVGKGVTFGDLKGTLDTAMKKLLGEDTKTRFRPSIFPFTEPSAEVDVSCKICSGTGTSPHPSPSKRKGAKKCSMCSGSGWVELLGSGMVNPKVLKACNIDPNIYSGFAFGMGIDRIAAQRFGISSSRMMYQSKLKLNEQF